MASIASKLWNSWSSARLPNDSYEQLGASERGPSRRAARVLTREAAALNRRRARASCRSVAQARAQSRMSGGARAGRRTARHLGWWDVLRARRDPPLIAHRIL